MQCLAIPCFLVALIAPFVRGGGFGTAAVFFILGLIFLLSGDGAGQRVRRNNAIAHFSKEYDILGDSQGRTKEQYIADNLRMYSCAVDIGGGNRRGRTSLPLNKPTKDKPYYWNSQGIKIDVHTGKPYGVLSMDYTTLIESEIKGELDMGYYAEKLPETKRKIEEMIKDGSYHC